MRPIKTAVLIAALALAAGLLVPSAQAAGAAPHTLPAVAVRTVEVDVDGDAVADTVTVTPLAATSYSVAVQTADGEVASATVHSSIAGDWGVEPWYGAARLDGVRGHELLLLTSGGDGVMFRVLTWRSGTLVLEGAPRSLAKGAYDWYLADLDQVRFGYRFSTRDGRRFVKDVELFASGSRWKGTIVTSVWKAGAWKRTATKKVSLTASQAAAYRGLAGVTVVAKP